MQSEPTNLSNEGLALDILADMVCQYLDSLQQETAENSSADKPEVA